MDQHTLTVGARVRLHAPSPVLALTSDLGTVVRPDPDDNDIGLWIVRLDEPATLLGHAVEGEQLTEIVEHADNMTVIGY